MMQPTLDFDGQTRTGQLRDMKITVRNEPPRQSESLGVHGERQLFAGETYDPERDGERLAHQFNIVKACLDDGSWWTLESLSMRAHGSTAAVSARVRDLRKPKFGKHEIQRRYLADGVWVYRHALEVCCG